MAEIKKAKKLDFTKKELEHYAITILLISIIYTFFFRAPTLPLAFLNLLQVIIIIGISFLVHQLAHKFVAESQGLKIEYRIKNVQIPFSSGVSNISIIQLPIFLITIVLGFFSQGIVFLYAIGGLEFDLKKTSKTSGFFNLPSQDRIGLVAIAGPLGNILFAVVIRIIGPFLIPNGAWLPLVQINAMMAVTYLIPLPPFDGAQILFHNVLKWSLMMLAALISLILLPYIPLFLTIILAIILFFALVIYVTFFSNNSWISENLFH